MKICNVFASTQLRITRLRKYPIDPKAYLGRCASLAIILCSEHKTKVSIRLHRCEGWSASLMFACKNPNRFSHGRPIWRFSLAWFRYFMSCLLSFKILVYQIFHWQIASWMKKCWQWSDWVVPGVVRSEATMFACDFLSEKIAFRIFFIIVVRKIEKVFKSR